MRTTQAHPGAKTWQRSHTLMCLRLQSPVARWATMVEHRVLSCGMLRHRRGLNTVGRGATNSKYMIVRRTIAWMSRAEPCQCDCCSTLDCTLVEHGCVADNALRGVGDVGNRAKANNLWYKREAKQYLLYLWYKKSHGMPSKMCRNCVKHLTRHAKQYLS